MYKDLLKQLLDKYGTTNDGLNYFIDLIGAYYLFRRNEWENDNDDEETKDRKTPTLSNIRTELRLIRQLKEENNTELLDYINDQSIAYIVDIEQLFYQFNIDIWYCHIDKAERLLDSWYRAIWYYGYYQEKNKPLSDELLAYLDNIDKITLSEQDIENNASLEINEKTKLCYLLAKHIHKKSKKDELLDFVNNRDNLLNSRVLTNLTLTTDLDKMLELTTRLTYHYLDTAILLDSITICFNDDIDNIIKKHNEELFNYEDIKDKVEDLKTYFLTNDNITDTEEETKEEQKKSKRLSNKQLKEKYKDVVLLNDEVDLNRKWAKLDTSKVNNEIMTMRENITSKVDSNTDLTIKELEALKSKPRKNKEDKEHIAELEQRLQEQRQEQKDKEQEIQSLKDDIDLINKQIENTTDLKQQKSLIRKRKSIEKNLKDMTNTTLIFQQDLFTGKYVYEKKNKRTKESYKLMINQDYNIRNFNQEGRNFLLYIPNIPDIIEQLDEDFITLDISNFLDFTGRENTNISRVRRNLLNTLIEMRKESYEYSFKDEKGVLQEGSLVLVADVKTTENKGKATVKVQLGATFKENIKNAIINGQIANVNRDIFKLGQGKNNKTELMAKELFMYFSRLARIDAKRGLTNGQYQKDLILDTLLEHLIDLNLIKYDLSIYNRSVREPLENALNMGQELGLFKYQTNAFKNYDEAINNGNNGRNAKDKVSNFENEPIRIILNHLNNDLEKMEQAHKTYIQNKRKYARKEATKK